MRIHISRWIKQAMHQKVDGLCPVWISKCPLSYPGTLSLMFLVSRFNHSTSWLLAPGPAGFQTALLLSVLGLQLTYCKSWNFSVFTIMGFQLYNKSHPHALSTICSGAPWPASVPQMPFFIKRRTDSILLSSGHLCNIPKLEDLNPQVCSCSSQILACIVLVWVSSFSFCLRVATSTSLSLPRV